MGSQELGLRDQEIVPQRAGPRIEPYPMKFWEVKKGRDCNRAEKKRACQNGDFLKFYATY
jgi:hypothetical protein